MLSDKHPHIYKCVCVCFKLITPQELLCSEEGGGSGGAVENYLPTSFSLATLDLCPP